MKTFYVTFGGLFRGYYVIFEARDEEIVRTWMNKRSGMAWSNIYDTPPRFSQPVREKPEVLCYEKAEHI